MPEYGKFFIQKWPLLEGLLDQVPRNQEAQNRFNKNRYNDLKKRNSAKRGTKEKDHWRQCYDGAITKALLLKIAGMDFVRLP